MDLRSTYTYGLAILFILCPGLAEMRDLSVGNTYTYAGDGRYVWTVFLKETPAILSEIRCVEYTLHPTFPNPVRRVCKSERGFPLSASGWGEFTLFLKIEWQDNHVTRQSYKLDLHSKIEKATLRKQVTSIRTGNVSKYLGDGQWSWTVFIVAEQEALDKIRCVVYTLHPAFPQPVQQVCERGETPNQAFALSATGWGTFDVGVKILFRDGRATFLNHTLKFGKE